MRSALALLPVAVAPALPGAPGQVLLPQAGIPAPDALGTIDGARSVRVQRAYLLAFADRFVSGRGGTPLSGPPTAYPEMRFLP